MISGMTAFFIKVCLQNFTREKDIYRGGHDELGSEITHLHIDPKSMPKSHY